MGATLQAWDPRLPENELVYGIEGGGGKAFPLAWLRERKGIVNDSVGGIPVVVVARGTLDIAAFDRRVKGRPLTFRPASGSRAVMNDEETGSDWSGEGESLAGPLRGERLEAADGYLVEWHVWSSHNPSAEVAGVPDIATSAVPDNLSFPSLVLADLDGQARPLTFPGSLNLVVLWAAWCPSCQDEMPRLARLVEAHAGQGLAAVGIAVHIPDEDEKAVVRRFVAEARLAFPTLLVNETAYDRLETLCRRAGGPGLVLPTVFLTDQEGKVLSVLRGKGVADLPRVVETLLARARTADP
jgi:thiol-disulfide isomerase/thioredoxin